jgi:hypothetical protein
VAPSHPAAYLPYTVYDSLATPFTQSPLLPSSPSSTTPSSVLPSSSLYALASGTSSSTPTSAALPVTDDIRPFASYSPAHLSGSSTPAAASSSSSVVSYTPSRIQTRAEPVRWRVLANGGLRRVHSTDIDKNQTGDDDDDANAPTSPKSATIANRDWNEMYVIPIHI